MTEKIKPHTSKNSLKFSWKDLKAEASGWPAIIAVSLIILAGLVVLGRPI